MPKSQDSGISVLTDGRINPSLLPLANMCSAIRNLGGIHVRCTLGWLQSSKLSEQSCMVTCQNTNRYAIVVGNDISPPFKGPGDKDRE